MTLILQAPEPAPQPEAPVARPEPKHHSAQERDAIFARADQVNARIAEVLNQFG